MNYRETIDYLYAQLPMFSRIGAAAYNGDLSNTIKLCDFLELPQNKFRSIHIAGTNGKGSTSHMLAAILQQAGYKTGLYTSPHLKDFRERIRVNGEMIAEAFVVDFTERTKPIAEAIKPSFFELTVAMAFDYFAKQKVDVAVIETGLGGRIDSTNVVIPELSIITNIGYDHMNLLGDTLELIAAEKAGIIKANVPVIIGEYLPETKPVFLEKAGSENAPIYFASDEYVASNVNIGNTQLECDVTESRNKTVEHYGLDLTGTYQLKNLCTVLLASSMLNNLGFRISRATEKIALANVKTLTGLHGRWDIIGLKPLTVLDVGHNEDGVNAIMANVKALGFATQQLHVVTGFVRDKEVDKVLALFPKNANYYFTQSHIPRALAAAELKEKANAAGLQGEAYPDVNIALRSALAVAGEDDLVLVCGSVFLVGEVEEEAISREL